MSGTKPFYFFILYMLPLFIGCRQRNEQASESYIDRFYKHELKFDSLIKSLRGDTLLINKQGETFNWMQFTGRTKEQLQELEIAEVYVFSWGPGEQQFDLKTNWRTSFPIHLYHNALDSVKTLKGFYKMDKGLNEIWGLGNNWALWIERKLIDAKR
jgi:hypothetical protein